MNARSLAVGVAAIGLALLVGGLVFLHVGAGSPPEPHGRVALTPDDADVVAQGRIVYAAHCASCHGPSLEGQPDWRRRNTDGLLPAPPHDETGHTWHHSDEALFELTKYGLQRFAGAEYRSAMPAYEGVLSDEDILAALSFIKSTWPDEIRAAQDQITAQ